MSTPLFRYSVAATLDGFIAGPDGGVAWLEGFDPAETGFAEFFADIGAIVMGRTTYDQAAAFPDWPYEGRRTVVLTSRPLDDPRPGVETHGGDIDTLAEELRRTTSGDVWLLGGAKAVRPFLDRGLVDRFELAVVPLLLGDGIPAFERSALRTNLRLMESKPYPNGIVMLTYALAG